MNRLLKTLLLALMGIFLYTHLYNGTILYYINQRFVTLTWLAAVGLVLVGVSYYRRLQDDHHHEHGDLTWVGLLIVSLPMLLGWLVPPQPLGAAAVSNREINIGTGSSLSSVAAPGRDNTMGLVIGEKNILDWLRDFQSSPDPAVFNGQEVHVIGFVYRDDRFADDQFMVARFTVSCCVADASPIGLIVRWPETAELPTDQWVDVTGHFEVGTFNGITMPILVADELTPTDPPAQPYLYL